MVKYTSSFGNNWSVQGHLTEDEVVSFLNINKSSNEWSVLANTLGINDLHNIYVVKVTSRVASLLSSKKIFPKSDAYLIKEDIPEHYLIKSDFLLSEDQLRKDGIDFAPISNSGISIKKSDSSRYTICKMSVTTFCKYFEHYEDARNMALALTMYQQNTKKLHNQKMLIDFGVEEADHRRYLEKVLAHLIPDIFDETIIASAARLTNQRVRTIIETDEYVRMTIFAGKHIFDDPYYASFVYSLGKMKNSVFEPYVITNGSGRSKGIYTLIVKPK